MTGAPSPTRHVPPGGPYCDDDLEFWYVAVEDAPYLEARRLVKGTADVDQWQRLAYNGKQMSYLWDGDEHEHDDSSYEDGHEAEACDREGCRHVMAWTFQVVERR